MAELGKCLKCAAFVATRELLKCDMCLPQRLCQPPVFGLFFILHFRPVSYTTFLSVVMMPHSQQNLENKLIHVGAVLVVLGLVIVVVAWIAFFIYAVAILIKAVFDHILMRLHTRTRKGSGRRPGPYSRKPDVLPTPVPDEEHTGKPNSIIYERAKNLDGLLKKVRDAMRMNDTPTTATETTSTTRENALNAAQPNYKYVTADLKYQLHRIESQGSQNCQRAGKKKDLQLEQSARISRQGMHHDEASFPRLLRKAAVADLHVPDAPSATSKEEDWIDEDDETSAEDDVTDLCAVPEKKPCTKYIIPRLMPKESTNAKTAVNPPLSSFDETKAKQVMGDKSIMSFDEFTAAYYKNTTAKKTYGQTRSRITDWRQRMDETGLARIKL